MREYNEDAVKTAILECMCERYNDIPAEAEIDYTFSKKFERWAKKLMDGMQERNDERILRFRAKALKTIALIAALVALLATTAMAVPAIREAIMDFFFHDRGESYGVTFDPEAAATAPEAIETVMVPTAIPDGFEIMVDDKSSAAVMVWWANSNDEWICYNQELVPRDVDNNNWFGVDTERSTHTTCTIQGYKVEKVQNDEIYTVFWTDNSYFYWIEFSNTIDFSVFEAMLASMTIAE